MSQDEELDEIVQEFLIESIDGLDQLDRDLVELEKHPQDARLLAGVFRCLHTIKGASGLLGFERLQAVSHAGESLLGQLREGSLALDGEVTDALLAMVDAIRRLLGQIEASGRESAEDLSPLIGRIERILAREASLPSEEPLPFAPLAPDVGPEALLQEPVEEPEALLQHSNAQHGGAPSTIRVDVGLLDELMNLVGELVLARNELLQHTGRLEDVGVTSTSQRVSHITTELQARIMKTRMQPIGNVWHKLPRLVRDTAAACGKKVALVLEGQETELDKTLLEAIKDPLVHIVRNAVDHGLEYPLVRRERGKPAEGTLRIRAYHEGGQVNIEITDDGRGIDPQRVGQRAVERGLISSDRLARMSEREMVDLVFKPGFSTADQVTNLSGRGVGMDVVRTNIEKIGGLVDVETCVGKGTTLKLKIPLTLAIIPALIVVSCGQRFALPQVNLHELVRLDREHALRGIEKVHGVPVYRLRGRLLPLVRLDTALQMGQGREEPEETNIIVLQGGDRRFGLVVDGVLDTEEIVVKPLSAQLKGQTSYAGATIMGDGRVVLILDALGLAQDAGLTTQGLDRLLSDRSAVGSEEERHDLLLVRVGPTRRLAIPLSTVARLEEVPRSALERVGQDTVVQYRGGILPLVPVGDILGIGVQGASPTVHIVVCSTPRGQVGLVVDAIHDIISEPVTIHPVRSADPVCGYAVVQSRVVELLDMDALLERSVIPLIQHVA